MPVPLQDDRWPQLLQLVNGYQVSQAISVVARRAIPDRFANGPRHAAEIASELGVDSDGLYRVLRALTTVGVFTEEADGRFGLAPLGELLRSDDPQSLAGWAAYIGETAYWETWGHLDYSVRTGAPAFPAFHDGKDAWTWRAERPDASKVFDSAMESLSGSIRQVIADRHDFSRVGCLADIGGGNGALLATVLPRYPSVQGLLFDQPQVVAGAESVLREAGVSDRCRVVGGDFFEHVPAGADTYLLKSILHDWSDENSVAILRTVRRACGPGARLLVVERTIGEPNRGRGDKFSDLNMLVMLGGKERSELEWSRIIAAGGFVLEASHSIAPGWSVFECRPV